ncbi:tyrosine-type recombinase/integrase [Streptomyces sp. NPDC047028]|uniref:site-specific integrase n=1 Tax=Streptomyces sp. NPDC047028 TaxID=3155793 RepID=UPI0033D1D9DC
MTGKRGDGEGSIYPYKNGFAAYVWVDTPHGARRARCSAVGAHQRDDGGADLQERRGPVNLGAGEITVQTQLQRINRRLVHDVTKTEASTATLPLPEICAAALRLRRKEQELSRQAAGEVWTANGFVFTTRCGTPFEPRNFNRRFMDRSARAGVRRIRSHDTRHTCGSLLAALDTHPRVPMQILRHSKIAMTMEAYTHVPLEATRRALRKLGKRLGKQDPK